VKTIRPETEMPCRISEQFDFAPSKLPENHKFRNLELEKKTAELQAEFQALLNSTGPATRKIVDGESDNFYEIMEQVVSKPSKHESPTRRLRDMKDSAVEKKQHLQGTLRRTQDYQLTYCPSPDRAYVIEPKGGEIDYDMAYKNPLKFIDQVLAQDIQKHTVRQNKEQVASKDAKGRSSVKVPLETYHKEQHRKVGKVISAEIRILE
jgi:hypothetical protein